MRVNCIVRACAAVALGLAVCAVPAHAAITVQRAVSPASYTPGQDITVTITLQRDDARTPTALGVRDTTPGTWTLKGCTAAAGMMPAVYHENTAENGAKNMEFAYITIPAFPVTFTYTVTTGADDTGPQSISGYALYRYSGDEERSPVVTSTVTAISPATEGEQPTLEGETAGEGEVNAEGEPVNDQDNTGCAGCNDNAKRLGLTLGDLFLSGLTLLTLATLSRRTTP